MKFWRDESPYFLEPRYAVEIHGRTIIFTTLEDLLEYRDKLAHGREKVFSEFLFQPLKSWLTGNTSVHGHIGMIKFWCNETFVNFRHHQETLDFLDSAIEHFQLGNE